MCFVVVSCIFKPVFGQQNIVTSDVRSFTRSQYGGGAQNWAITKDESNRLYIANNEGLLVFDGTKWQVFPVPNKTILRSISFGANQKLFAGAQDELGYYWPDKKGNLVFTSLKDKIPLSDRNFADVWELEVFGEEVFFRTSTKIFRLMNNEFTVYPAAVNWVSLKKHLGKIVAQDPKLGILRFQNNSWINLIAQNQLPSNFVMTDVAPYKTGVSLVSSVNHGLFLLTNNDLKPFKFSNPEFNSLQHITSLSMLKDSSFLIGTYYTGVYHISPNGKVLGNVSAKNGLPNNTVRCVFDDKNGNVWAGLDNGIGFFSYDNAIHHINPIAFNNGVGYNAAANGNDLYFALSTGLYKLPFEPWGFVDLSKAKPQNIVGGLTWSVTTIGNKILAGRDDGLWKVSKTGASAVSNTTGYWTMRPIPGTLPQQYAAGNYIGVEKYNEVNGNLIGIGQLEKFTESSRYLESEANDIWVSHPYRGVYKISLIDNAVELFSDKNGLPAVLDNHVFKVKNKIVVATSAGIYEYDGSQKKMVKSKQFEPIFGSLPIRYLKEDAAGNIWFVQEKMTGVVDYSSGKPRIHYIPELKNKILSGFENILPINSKNVIIGGEAGFYHVNYDKYKEGLKPFTAFVTQVKTTGLNSQMLFGGYQFNSTTKQKSISVPYKYNSLLFAYAASAVKLQHQLEFSYYLQGFDKNWSEWSSQIEKEYTNLPEGSYTFKIQARQSPSYVSEVFEFEFEVQPPWFRTIWAYLFYLLVAASTVYGILNLQGRNHKKKQEASRKADLKKFEEEQKQLAYQHRIALTESEKELIRLQNEKLEWEVGRKNAELANATMNLVQKKEFILKLKAELQKLQKTDRVGDDDPELKKVLKALSEEEKLDDEWEQFSQHFNSVHGDFLKVLKSKYPVLKPHELRLCAYLRLNLSSKEIAPLMSISLRGVEISRYRLRKKMELPTEVNLVQYLMDLQS